MAAEGGRPRVTQDTHGGRKPTLVRRTVGSYATLAAHEPARSFNVNRDLLRIDGRDVRNVHVVAHQQLQRVLARRQIERGLRLTRAEMQMLAIGGNLLIERLGQVRIDQQMMVAGIRILHPTRGDPHVTQPEPYAKWLA